MKRFLLFSSLLFSSLLFSSLLISCVRNVEDDKKQDVNDPEPIPTEYLYKVVLGAAAGVDVASDANGQTAIDTGVEKGTSVSYTATVTDPEYDFSHWTVASTVADFDVSELDGSTGLTLTFTMPEGSTDGEVVATITPVISPKGKYKVSTGTVAGVANYAITPTEASTGDGVLAGTSITVTPTITQTAKYEYATAPSWTVKGRTSATSTENLPSTSDNSLTFTIGEWPVEVTPTTPTKRSYAVDLTSTAVGGVPMPVPTTPAPGAKVGETQVEVTAGELADYTFVGWEFSGTALVSVPTAGQLTTSPIEFTMPWGDVTVSASYRRNIYRVSVDKTATGMSVSDGTNGAGAIATGVVSGTSVNYTASVDAEYDFGGWTVEPAGILGATDLTATTLTFAMPQGDADGEVVATITPVTTIKPKYTLSVNKLPSAISVSPSSDPATVTSDGVLATQSVELTAPAAPTGYEWVGWQHTGSVALTSGSDWSTPTIEVFVTSTGATVTAEYKEIGVVVNGIVWAKTNLSAAGTFAASPSTTSGYYFSFADAQTACPTGWRLPTDAEIDELVGQTATTCSWTTGTGVTNGLKVVVDATGEELYFPNAGRHPQGSGSTATDLAGTHGFYWSSVAIDSDNAYLLSFHSNIPDGLPVTGTQTQGFPVRCVK